MKRRNVTSLLDTAAPPLIMKLLSRDLKKKKKKRERERERNVHVFFHAIVSCDVCFLKKKNAFRINNIMYFIYLFICGGAESLSVMCPP